MAESSLLNMGLGLEIGSGATIGFLTGLAAKKVTKLIALAVGGFLLLLKWMEGQGFLSVDWGSLTGGLIDAGSAAAGAAPTAFDMLVQTAGLGGSFGIAFLLGFKKG